MAYHIFIDSNKMSESDSDSEGTSDALNTAENGFGLGGLIKGPWVPIEDALLTTLVARFGAREWATISSTMIEQGHHRLGKQCRERYEKNGFE